MIHEELEILNAIENLENNEVVAEHHRETHVYRDGFNMSDKKFLKTYRLTKDLTRELINVLEPFINHRERVSGLLLEEKALIALNFFASGSYQHGVGNNKYVSVSQSTVSKCVEEVTTALNNPQIFNRYVKFPENLNQLNSLRMRFYENYGMPGIIGCIDCTHVAIVPPKTNDPDHPEHIYVNRKSYHSINVQLVCDERMKILHVNARFPGSTHDSHIWNNSNIEPVLQNLYETGHEGYFLLGDSGYPLRPWLLTPLNNVENDEEERYNEIHKRARATIERCNGLLKMRFRCLLKHRVLHYTPTKSSKIINACIVLHNMCIENNVDLIQDEEENLIDFGNNIDDVNVIVNNPRVNIHLLQGRRVQRRIVNYFRR